MSGDSRRTLTVGFFGTSIMEHLEAFNTQMTSQANLPEIGAKVTVEGWHKRGWVHRLVLSLRASHPKVSFDIHNHGEGGATSRDVASIVRADRTAHGIDYDLVFVGCGINDVWRRFQNRAEEAVGLGEYTQHLNTTLEHLRGYSHQLIVISETPFGPVAAPETVAAMNVDLPGTTPPPSRPPLPTTPCTSTCGLHSPYWPATCHRPTRPKNYGATAYTSPSSATPCCINKPSVSSSRTRSLTSSRTGCDVEPPDRTPQPAASDWGQPRTASCPSTELGSPTTRSTGRHPVVAPAT